MRSGHWFDSRFPVAVVAITGDLDPAAATAVVEELRRCLVDDQPVEMVVDVSECTVRSLPLLRQVRELADDARRWPGTRVALAGASPELTAGLGPIDSFPGIAEAVAGGQAQRVPPQASADLPPTEQAPAAGRELIARACRSWRITRLQGLAQLLGSELISNAVVHAGTRLRLMVRHTPPVLQVAVRDHDPRPLPPPPAAPEFALADVGRGTLLLETLADDWGCLPTDDGKVVWASITEPAADPADRAAPGDPPDPGVGGVASPAAA